MTRANIDLTKMTKIIWFTAILSTIGLGIFLNIHENSELAAGNSDNFVDKQPIVIGYSNWYGWWPWAIAESEGLFAKHNLNAELRWYDNYTDSLEDLKSGFIDANSQTLNDTITFAESALKGETIVVVNDNSAGNDKIIVDENINSVSDLKGKTVAVEAGVVDDFLLTLALKKSNIDREEVNIVDVETGSAVAAFAAGEVNAVGAFPPFWIEALARPRSREIISSDAFPGAIPDLLVVTEELANKQPDRVQKLVATWFDILQFMSDQPLAAESIMANQAEVSIEEFQLFKQGTEMFDLQKNIYAFEKREDISSLHFAASEIEEFLNEYFLEEELDLDLKRIFSPQFVRAYASRN